VSQMVQSPITPDRSWCGSGEPEPEPLERRRAGGLRGVVAERLRTPHACSWQRV